MSWDARLVWLIAGVTLVSYLAGRMIEILKKRWMRRAVLVGALGVSLGLLFFYKYFNFFSESVGALLTYFALPVQPITLKLILPVGISFYTFQTLSYVIDVYRGQIKAEHHLGVYALYVSFFPQLVAGPIERSTNLLPQFYEKHVFQYDQVMYGLKTMGVGFFKKLLIADYLAGFVNSVYNNLPEYSGFSLVVASVLFSIQIYCDFSGYSDIAIGAARMMGFSLMKNFDAPYLARSVRNFWRRWHISLSSWLMDYVYIPLGGSRVSRGRHYFNLMATFLLSGLWHGANWTFVVWGALHGLYLVVGNATANLRRRAYDALGISPENRLAAVWQILITYVLVCAAWVIFRANTLGDAGYVLAHMLDGIGRPLVYIKEGLAAMDISALTLLRIVFLVGVLLVLDVVSQREDPIQRISRWPLGIKWSLYVLFMIMMIVLSPHDAPADFIYFQF
jgi:alginate O-acetyltransferase complex protein AlgI